MKYCHSRTRFAGINSSGNPENYLLRNLLRNKVSNNMKNKEIRKLTRIGKRSIGLTLPIEMVRELGWRERQRVVVKKANGSLIIRDYRSKK